MPSFAFKSAITFKSSSVGRQVFEGIKAGLRVRFMGRSIAYRVLHSKNYILGVFINLREIEPTFPQQHGEVCGKAQRRQQNAGRIVFRGSICESSGH